MTVTYEGGGESDSGTYRFADGGYCSSWKDLRNGEEACYTVEMVGDGQYQLYTKDGQKDDLFTKQ